LFSPENENPYGFSAFMVVSKDLHSVYTIFWSLYAESNLIVVYFIPFVHVMCTEQAERKSKESEPEMSKSKKMDGGREIKIEHTTYDQARHGHMGVQAPDPAWEEERRTSYATGQRLYGSQNTGVRHRSGHQAGERVTMWPTQPQPTNHAVDSRVGEGSDEAGRSNSTTVESRGRREAAGGKTMNSIPTHRHYDPGIKPSRAVSPERKVYGERRPELRRKSNFAQKIRDTFRGSGSDKERERDRGERDRMQEKKYSMEKIKRHRKAIDEGRLEKVVPPSDGLEMGRRAPRRPGGDSRREIGGGQVETVPLGFKDSSPYHSPSQSQSHSRSQLQLQSYSESYSESSPRESTRDTERGKHRRPPSPDHGFPSRDDEDVYSHPRVNWKGIGESAPNDNLAPPSSSRSRSRSQERLSPHSHHHSKPSHSRDRLSPSPHRSQTSHASNHSNRSTRLADYISSGADILDEARRKVSSQFKEPFEFMSYPIFHNRPPSSSSAASFYCRGEDVETDSMRVVIGGEGETLWEGKQLMECRYCKEHPALARGLCRVCQKGIAEREESEDEWTSQVYSDEEAERDEEIMQPTPRRVSTYSVLAHNRSKETLAIWTEEEGNAKEEIDKLSRSPPPLR